MNLHERNELTEGACARERKRVVIVMCTFNGERFLKEQLDSFAAQRYTDFRIALRDDCSADRTMEIVGEWAEENPTIPLEVIPNESCSLGYPACFYEALLKAGEADYYAFADQDDIWLPNKIQAAVEALDGLGPEEGSLDLYYSAFDFYDENMGFLHHSYYASRGSARPHLRELAFGGQLSGFAMVINKATRDYLCPLYEEGLFDIVPSKDVFIGQVCAALGRVVYDREPRAKYRRHSKATTYTGSSPFSNIVNKSKLLWSRNSLRINADVVDYLLARERGRLNEEDLAFCEIFASSAGGIRQRFKKFLYLKRMRTRFIDEVALRVLLLCGKGCQ